MGSHAVGSTLPVAGCLSSWPFFALPFFCRKKKEMKELVFPEGCLESNEGALELMGSQDLRLCKGKGQRGPWGKHVA